MYDVLISGGELIDGTGAPRQRADVAIQNGQIIACGRLEGAAARIRIEASGLVVAPGFIDVHTHSDGWLLKTPHLLPKTAQGFTTEVLMADGISYAPVDPHTARSWMYYLRALNGLQLADYAGWETLDDYARQLDGRTVQNFMLHVPYANVRTLACGFERQAPDDFQLKHIASEIRRGMEMGAVGLSTGLDYIAQCHATTDELVAACSAMAPYEGLYVTHIRYKRGLLPALEEAVEIGRRAGVRVHISHLKAQSSEQVEQVLTYVDQVARKQVDFSFDVYPYQPSSTMLNFLLPYEVWRRGPLAALAELARFEVRRRFAAVLSEYRVQLERIRIAWLASRANQELIGMRLADYVQRRGLPAEDALCDLLIEENLAVLLVFEEGDDRLVHPFLQHDLYMMGSDGIYFPEGMIHPRMYGSAGRLLGPCVRQWKLFSLEQAVHRLTGRPAQRFGLARRGELCEGAVADVVVFHPAKIADEATYDHPQKLALGMEHVFVAGVPVIRHGRPADFEASDSLPGRYLRYQPAH